MRRTMTEKNGAWVLGALLVAGMHHLMVQDAGDASFASGTGEARTHALTHSGAGLVATRDVSALWPIGAMPSMTAGTSATSGDAGIDAAPTFSSRVGGRALLQGPSQGR